MRIKIENVLFNKLFQNTHLNKNWLNKKVPHTAWSVPFLCMWLVWAPAPTPDRDHRERAGWPLGGCSGCPETPHHFPWHLVNSMTLLLSCYPSEAVTAGAVPACHQIHHSQRHSHFIFEALSSLTLPDCTDYTWIQTDGGLRPKSALPPCSAWEGGEVQGVRKCSVPFTAAQEAPGGQSQSEPSGIEIMILLDKTLG